MKKGASGVPVFIFRNLESALLHENSCLDKQEGRIHGKVQFRNGFIVKAVKPVKYCGHPKQQAARQSAIICEAIPLKGYYWIKAWGNIKSPLRPAEAKEMER
ncbi:hypothetical protein [Paenibacillus sp. sgz5001063]|uniref:hypothetical protein n=1 Tax=Paenibacillus sp. sgz5001063 TaxID=3242474 RepID=UPI0036D391AF